ncbi:MAG: DUF1697 domain-containing protein, partial [Bacteroidia bacterium]|nr:DUF1697 domain-containing protein [Bacteroidia bacterium]
MEKLVALLRGINVSGQKIIPMKELQGLFEKQGLGHVKTYIQSGNVVFTSSNRKGLELLLEQAILEHFGYEVPVFIRSQEELQDLVGKNPFESPDREKSYLVFLEKTPTQEQFKKAQEFVGTDEELVLVGKEIYLKTPSYGNTKINNNFLENKLQQKASTRNWNTTN